MKISGRLGMGMNVADASDNIITERDIIVYM